MWSSARGITSRLNLELRGEVLNAFNNINFTPVAQAEQQPDHQPGDRGVSRHGNTQDFGGRMMQLAARISW